LFFVSLQSQEFKLHKNLGCFVLCSISTVKHLTPNILKCICWIKEWINFEKKNMSTKHNVSYHMFCKTLIVRCTSQCSSQLLPNHFNSHLKSKRVPCTQTLAITVIFCRDSGRSILISKKFISASSALTQGDSIFLEDTMNHIWVLLFFPSILQ